MEFYSSSMKKVLMAVSISIMTIIMVACSSDAPNDASTLIDDISVQNALIKNADGSETIILSNGEQIVLEDTITHVMNFDMSNTENDNNDVMLPTRGILHTGYDREDKPKDNKKYMLKGLEKYGISPNTIYIGKFITYYKDLPVSKGYSLFPSNSKYETENCMGFNPPSLTNVGFHTIVPDTWTGYETGITQIFYVVCDASGISWNKNVPCNPTDFIWYFRSFENE